MSGHSQGAVVADIFAGTFAVGVVAALEIDSCSSEATAAMAERKIIDNERIDLTDKCIILESNAVEYNATGLLWLVVVALSSLLGCVIDSSDS